MADKARDLSRAAGGILGRTREGGASGSRVGDRVKLATYVSADLADAIQALADADRRSVSFILGEAIAEYVEAHYRPD